MQNFFKLFMTLFAVSHLAFGAGKTSSPALIPEGSHISKHHEVLLNAGEFVQDEVSDAKLSFNNLNRLAIGGAYFYRLNEMFEIGPRVAISYLDAGTVGVTYFSFLASGRVNIPLAGSDFENSFFGGGSFGIGTVSSGTTSRTTAIFAIEAGKRFLLFPNFTWQPTFAVTIPTNGSFGSVSFAFRLLAASLVF